MHRMLLSTSHKLLLLSSPRIPTNIKKGTIHSATYRNVFHKSKSEPHKVEVVQYTYRHYATGGSQSGVNNQLYYGAGIAAAIAVAGGLVYYLKVMEPGADIKSSKNISDTSGKAADSVGTKSKAESEYISPTLNPGEIAAFPTGYPDYEVMPDIPGYTPYVIIGAGTAAAAAFRGIKIKDPKAQVLVIGEEPFEPYMRTPLSKEMWYTDEDDVATSLRFNQWSGTKRSIFHHPQSIYCKPKELAYQEKGGVAVLTSHKVDEIDAMNRKVILSNGWEVFYDKCLIATGGTPRNLKVIERAGKKVAERVILYRGIKDFKRLDAITRDSKTKKITIVGGGFLGSELACSLAYRSSYMADKNKLRGDAQQQFDIVQVFPESGNMGRVLPEYLSKWTTEKVRSEGVEVISEAYLTDIGISKDEKELMMTLSNGKKMTAEYVIVAVGLDATTELAPTSGLEVDPLHGGYLVNAELEARSNIWVAGDAACFYDIKLGRRRVEHHDHAVVSGRLAGENMTGAGKPYWHQSMFWSDLGPEVSYEAIGICDSSLQTVGVFAAASPNPSPSSTPSASSSSGDQTPAPESSGESTAASAGSHPDTDDGGKGLVELHPADTAPPQSNFGKGVIFYMKDKVIVGIIMWNVFRGSRAARKIIMDGGVREEAELVELAKLFNLYGDTSAS